ncbi:hypothetical protein MsAg5_18170 [Methanosarcinaceae archaeon Ag5]|uniref:Fibronectin type-III domain-containing protein n=1 Tax=Methanolapillus africanus TaxID=3028297 RepID=A0AAE4SDT1_9EURY|nr:hypothetical protein [Methanosarcinaceae archaeon Ag5]
MNKMIFKVLIALLVMFAMIGAASAAVGNLTLDSVNGTSGAYNMTWKWDGGGNTYSVSINGTPDASFDPTKSVYTLENINLSEDYVILVTDTTDSDTNTSTNKALDISATTLESTSATNDTVYKLVTNPTSTFQVYGSSWANYDDSTGISGSTSASTTVNYRLTDAGGNLSVNQSVDFPVLGSISSVNSTDAGNSSKHNISWTISDFNGWNHVEYSVYENTTPGTLILDNQTLASSSDKINVSNLESGKTYVLQAHGVTSSGTMGATTPVGYSLLVTNEVTLAAAATPLFPSDGAGTTGFDGNNTSINITGQFNTNMVVNATTLVNCSFEWTLNNSSSTVETKNNVTDSKTDNFTWTPNATGKYTLKLVVKEVANNSNNQTLTWNITVTERDTGNRVWTPDLPDDKYIWDARSFSGFYYNLDTGEGDEKMTIYNISRSISKGDIEYITTPSVTNFSYSGWNTYNVVGFMGDKYFAGYDNTSLMSSGYLSKVLIDSDEKINANMGQYIPLEEGYSLKVSQVDVNGNKVLLVLEKDGKEIVTSPVAGGADFEYEKKIGGNNTVIVKAHVDSVFQGTESSLVTVRGLFQISDNLTKLESGTKIDKMEITNVGSTQIEMKNHESVSLSAGSNITLMGKMKIEVADDSSQLRFAPYIEYTEPGKYEIRGTVSDYGTAGYDINQWTPRNFEGFYYDIDDNDFNTESITVSGVSNSSRTIAKGNLTYKSEAVQTEFNHTAWQKYYVVGFMGEKYFAGYNDTSLLNSGYLSKVLIDDDDKRNANMGQYIPLEDGYSIKVSQVDVNGNKALLVLEKNGKEIVSSPVSGGGDFEYEKKIGNNNTVIIKAHVDSVFQGTESSIVVIKGLFQISDNVTKLDDSARYGKMEVSSHSGGIELVNRDTVGLSSGNTVDFMTVGNTTMSFKVGDNSTLRYAPIVIREVGSNASLEVKASPNPVTVGKAVNITVSDRGTTLEGATVIANGTTVGTTNSSGMISYTPNSVGTIKITATKSGYVDGSASLTVQGEAKNMSMSISPDSVYPGTTVTIRVYDSLNNSSISGAKIYVGSDNVGSTDSSGQLNYTFNSSGTFTVLANATDYLNTSKTVNVVSKVNFVFSNYSLSPENLSAGKTTKLSFDITNNGIESGSHTVTLQLVDAAGTVVDEDSKTVSLDVGKSKSVTLSVKPKTEGTYSLVLKEDNNVVSNVPSNIGTVSVGPSSGLFGGSTAVYVVIAIVAIIVLAVLGYLGYLFGVKGATRSNYKEVSGQVTSDLKNKFKRNK